MVFVIIHKPPQSPLLMGTLKIPHRKGGKEVVILHVFRVGLTVTFFVSFCVMVAKQLNLIKFPKSSPALHTNHVLQRVRNYMPEIQAASLPLNVH